MTLSTRARQLVPRWPRTLRGRLVAAVAAVLVVGFAAVGVTTTLVLHHVLLDRLDAQLRAAGSRFSVGLEHNDHDADNDPSQFGAVEGQAAGTLGARVKNGVTTVADVVGSSDSSGAPPAAAQRVLAGLHTDSAPRSVTLPGLGAYRLIVTAGQDGDVLITGLPLDQVSSTIDELVLIEALVFLVAVLAIGAASATVVRRGLHPLAQVAAIASSVAELPLSRGAVQLPDRAAPGPRGSEVETVSTAFNTMLEEVESALQERHDSEERLRRFLADASHELRTPVAVVRGHAEYALRADPDVSGEVRHALERIGAQSERMGHLVDDLLLLARLDSGRPLAREQVDVTRVVLDSVADARVAGLDHRWILDLPDEVSLMTGDENGLRQVLANLLANARIHTPAGTAVRTTLRRSADTIRISVEDDGPGVPPAALGHVFERFVRGEGTRSSSTGGSGLGLPIVDAIVRAHGGSVDLATDPTGTRISIVLPNPSLAPHTAG